MGKGYAVRAGILRALALTPEPSFIGFSDADLSVSPEQWENSYQNWTNMILL